MFGINYGIGLHRYNPLRFPAIFLDVSDAQYNPLDPSEIVVGIHPAEQPGNYGVAKFKEGRLVTKILLPYRWGSDLEFYIDGEKNLLYIATGTSIIEIRSLENLKLVKKVSTEVNGITSVAIDSEDRVWFISNPFRGGDGWIYRLEENNAMRVRRYSAPVSLDSLRISPWGRKLLVADYKRHMVECIGEEGESLGVLYFPYVSGVKWTLDERVLVCSGKYDKHVFLLLITSAIHNTIRSSWYGYLMDYGVQASNRADSFYLDRVLIQWYLGFSEVKLPLPKEVPFSFRVGNEIKKDGSIGEQGFVTFTPIVNLNKCHIIATPYEKEIIIERLMSSYSIISPKWPLVWEEIDRFMKVYEINVPGIYRLKSLSNDPIECFSVCKP